MNKLSGQVAIITGAASGIGRSTAELFAQEGAKVIVADVNEALGQETADQIEANGGTARFITTDVGSADSVQTLVKTVLDEFDRIDILHNNAYWAPNFRPLGDTTLEEWDRTIAVSLTGVFLGCKYVLPTMLERGKGVIVNTASAAAISASPMFAAYMAAKGGVVQLTRSVAYDYGKSGIRCNAICPGLVETPATQPVLDDPERRAWLMSKLLLSYTGKPEDIAKAALFLATDDSRYMTGQTLVIDGGRVLS